MYENIRANLLKGMIGRVEIIDIRKPFIHNLGSIPSSRNIETKFLIMDPDRYLDRDKKYYIYCNSGIESPIVCEELTRRGFKVANVLGGYQDYIMS